MATIVHIVGKGPVAFDWDGRLINVQHLRVAYGRKILINWHAHTAMFENNRYRRIDPDGTFTFSSLEYGSGTVINYPEPMGVHFKVGLLVRLMNIIV